MYPAVDNMESDVPALNQRFLIVLDQLGLSGYAVAKLADIAEPTISYIRSGKQKPSIELIEWLLLQYPTINADFLLRGEGEPLVRVGINIVNSGTNHGAQGNGSVYNYAPAARHQQQLLSLQSENKVLQNEIRLKDEMLSLYRTLMPEAHP
ncbi:hypothetical protein FAES_4066 [Fibrella aestuarina BUZ 2]|uniref:HTH cro/C1-type domain-containing protein n=1 Tax=Fibrella aestuarina BUZ 2 TaxID=1166018 RepID=I0KD63_9BACT|nr:helix-turn-helix transcriptional regulator [Fibrella aestuarina]CCH02066.1 hypothetical protein FAES_4066 [Fibrella aestuarina BUZ 2]